MTAGHTNGTAQLAATAYAAAALGEHVLNLFQMLGRPVLVVEYLVNEGDTLNGRALWEIGEGYAVVPVLFEPAGALGKGKARVPTLDDSVITLEVGDRLVADVASGAIALGKNIPYVTHDQLNVLPESEWQTQKQQFILETWLERVRQASSSPQ